MNQKSFKVYVKKLRDVLPSRREVNKEKHVFLLTQLSENHFTRLRTTCVQGQPSKKDKITGNPYEISRNIFSAYFEMAVFKK